MSEYKYIKIEKLGFTTLLTMSNPPVNVLTFPMLDEICSALEAIRQEDVRALVLASDQKIFAAGADIKNLKSCGPEENSSTSQRLQKAFLALESFPAPVICAVNGSCMGGGAEMALSCDLRVFEEGVKFAFPETGLGIAPGAGGTQRLTKLVGPAQAKRLIFTGEAIDTDEAFRLSICQYRAEKGKGKETALKIAETICGKGPLGVACAKSCIDFACEHSLQEGLEYENSRVSALFSTEDKDEGLTAFFEKRAPGFKNR